MLKRTALIILLIAFLCMLVLMIAQLFPLIKDMFDKSENVSEMVEYIRSIGWRGAPALVGLSMLQVIIPIIPAAVTGALAGLCYGLFWGTLIYLGGIALGNLFVVFFVRELGHLFARRKRHKSKNKNYLSKEELNKIKRPEIVAFFLFMIPFLSGAGPYLFADTNVSMWKYIIAVIAGSLPFAFVYLFLGTRLSAGNHMTAIIIAAIILLLLVFILVFRKKLIAKIMDI